MRETQFERQLHIAARLFSQEKKPSVEKLLSEALDVISYDEIKDHIPVIESIINNPGYVSFKHYACIPDTVFDPNSKKIVGRTPHSSERFYSNLSRDRVSGERAKRLERLHPVIDGMQVDIENPYVEALLVAYEDRYAKAELLDNLAEMAGKFGRDRSLSFCLLNPDGSSPCNFVYDSEIVMDQIFADASITAIYYK